MLHRLSVLSLLAFLFVSCQTVSINPSGRTVRYSGSPNYEKSQSFFLFGLIGESFIDVKSICGDRPVKQMQTQETFVDGLLGSVTLGIYTPRTASVWCGKKPTTIPEEEVL